MFSSSSQLTLDANPISSNADMNTSNSQSSFKDGPKFSEYLHKESEGKHIESKGNKNDSEKKQTEASKDLQRRANSSQTTKASKVEKPAENNKTEQAAGTETSKTNLQQSEDSDDVSTDNTTVEEVETQLADTEEIHRKFTNPLLSMLKQNLSANENPDNLSEGTQVTGEDSKKQSVQQLIAQMINNAQQKQGTAADEVGVEELPQQKDLEKSAINASDLLKLIAGDSKMRGIDSKRDMQLSSLTAKQESNDRSVSDMINEILNTEDAISLDNSNTDSLLDKIIERMDLAKNRVDLAFQEKIVNDKSASAADFVDQLTNKISSDSNDKSLLVNSNNINTINRNPATAPVQQFTLNTHVSQPEWGADFSKRIHFLMKNNIQHAELRLDPPELGRIHVKINMSQDQANISFSAAHGSVRDAIENTLPKLRDLLGESGIQLGDTNVSPQFQQQQQDNAQNDNRLAPPIRPNLFDESLPEEIVHVERHFSADGVIDYFA